MYNNEAALHYYEMSSTQQRESFLEYGYRSL